MNSNIKQDASRRYCITDAANKLSISTATMRRTIQRGEIGFVMIGKRRYIPQEAIDKYLTLSYEEPEEDPETNKNILRKNTACGVKRSLKSGDREYPLGMT